MTERSMLQVHIPTIPSAVSETLLISFCNQQSSPLHSLYAMDLSNGGGCWIDLSPIPEAFRESFAGICGVCNAGDQVVIATQSAKPLLAIVDLQAARVSEFVPLAKCKDTHSIVFHNGCVYAVSTGTNEIYRVLVRDQALGEEELYWQFPGVRYDRDDIHLNGITVDDGRFMASCFGEKNDDGSWGANGRVFYLDTGQVVHQGIRQPHTPLVIGEYLFFAESSAHKVYAFKKSGRCMWNHQKEIQIGGYTRGLAFRDGLLLVGISSSRKVSRSQKTVNTDHLPSSDTAIIAVEVATGKQEVVNKLEGFGREVYDLVPISNKFALWPVHDTVISRIREMESSVDNWMTDVGRLWLQMRDMQEVISKNSQELEQIRNSLSWRLTKPLRVNTNTFRKLLLQAGTWIHKDSQ